MNTMRTFLINSLVIIGLLTMISCGSKKSESKSGGITKDSLVSMNEGWAYLESSESYSVIKDKEFINEVNIPHCWNATDAVDPIPGYRRDMSWYKKTLELKEVSTTNSYKLYFEGANLKTEVFVNGESCGNHIGGYVGFDVDITSQLKKGKNEILISVTNAVDRELIPSQKSDFFIYGGITRDLWLKISPKESFNDFYPIISHNGGNKFGVKIDLKDAVTGAKYLVSIKKDGETVSEQEFSDNRIVITDFEAKKLWSVDEPTLYDLVVTQKKGDDIVFSKSKKVGFRYFEFKEKGAFYLNGERTIIRGTHRHEEHAGMGAAMSNELHYADMQSIKDMGANFVRLAHYPQDPEVYKACDELGLLVWDELPWCRGGLGNDVWQNNSKRLLKEQIYQNMHHTSIITWSMGNEMYWDEDFEGGGAIEPLKVFLKELCDISKSIDPTRPTSIRKFYEGADIVDLFSPSIWAGWYRGKYGEYEEALVDSREKYPRFVHMEYGCAAHKGRHDEDELSIEIDGGWEEDPSKFGIKNMAKNGTWSETYAVDLFDWHLHVSENLEWFTGNAQWAYKDFGTPLRPENPIPYINQKGIMDRAGQPKDAWYVFRSYWDTKKPFAYIQSHTWTERFGKEDEEKQIRVYSNCENAELFLNGKSLGKKDRELAKFPAHGLVWKVKFKEGENTLSCNAIKDGKGYNDEVVINYSLTKASKPAKILITSEKAGERIKVTARVVDKAGIICQSYRRPVYIDVNGGAELIADLGTNDGSRIIEPMNGQVTFYLNSSETLASVIEVRNQDFKGAYLNVPAGK